MKRNVLRRILGAALALVVLVSGAVVARDLLRARRERAAYAALASQVRQLAEREEPASEVDSSSQQEEAPGRLQAYRTLAEENPDLIGWVSIPGTGVDYPVLYTPEDLEYYLRRDFYGNSASGGTPFLDGRNEAQAKGQNLIVYGHNMLDGTMFKPVLQYFTPNFQVTHEDIYLELDNSQYHYQVLAALETNTRSPVYTYTDLSDAAEMEGFRAMLLEETGVGAIPQAEGYLTLSTCNDQSGNSRVLVIAALVEEVST